MRHAEYEANVLKITNGNPDIIYHLTDKGIKQAKKAKKFIDKEEFDICFRTPMIRTFETGQIVLDGRDIEVIIDERITEFVSGIEGESTKKFWNIINRGNDKWKTKVAGKESFYDIEIRVRDFLDELKQKKYDRVLIITHEGIMVVMEKIIKNLSGEQALKLKFDNCQIIRYEI